jgi:hypothetical protein
MMSLGVLVLDGWGEQIYMHMLQQTPATSLLILVLGSLLLSTGLTLFLFCINLCEVIASQHVFNDKKPAVNGGECCAALVADAC